MFFRVPAGASSSGGRRVMAESVTKAAESKRLAREFH